MKLIKKIAAIMFAFMMVVSMSCNVKADEGTTATIEKGIITINKAVNGQTYTIYKLLDLESYEPKKNEQGEEIGNYSYKPNTDWNDFISEAADSANIKYFDINKNGYVTWNGDITDSRKAEFAQKALAYATANNISNKGTKPASNNTVKFENLDLGYYLVDSSVGALCSLDTTNPNATIQEKNGVPSVEKTITAGGTFANDGKSNSVNIGDTISFQIRIDVRKGANNYVLHDELSSGLTLKENPITKNPIHLQADENIKGGLTDQDYTLTINSTGFDVTFKPEFLKKHEDKDYSIMVTYNAILNEKAVIGGKGNTNETYLKYGEASGSIHSTTTTYTFGIPVLKYTGDVNNPLAGAKFKLYTNPTCNDDNTALKFKLNGAKYRYDSTNGEYVLTSLNGTGHIDIEGLEAGTYYLKEIEAPKGYNKLAAKITIIIDEYGNLTVNGKNTIDNKPITEVDVENKTGTVLPSTGGMGTTMIYLVGAVLVLGSGVVLATKRRVKNK